MQTISSNPPLDVGVSAPLNLHANVIELRRIRPADLISCVEQCHKAGQIVSLTATMMVHGATITTAISEVDSFLASFEYVDSNAEKLALNAPNLTLELFRMNCTLEKFHNTIAIHVAEPENRGIEMIFVLKLKAGLHSPGSGPR